MGKAAKCLQEIDAYHGYMRFTVIYCTLNVLLVSLTNLNDGDTV